MGDGGPCRKFKRTPVAPAPASRLPRTEEGNARAHARAKETPHMQPSMHAHENENLSVVSIEYRLSIDTQKYLKSKKCSGQRRLSFK